MRSGRWGPSDEIGALSSTAMGGAGSMENGSVASVGDEVGNEESIPEAKSSPKIT